MLCTESAKTCGTIASAVLIRICHLVMVTLQKKRSQTREGRARAFLSAFMAVKEALVFICTRIFCVHRQPHYGMIYWETGHMKIINK